MINRVILVGRLTKDVEVRKTQSGISVASFTVACDRRGGNRDAGGNQTADFINCVAWRQTADLLGAYARKGAPVGVEGRISTRSYDDRDGKRVYVTEVTCDNVQLLESRSASEARSQNSYGGNSYQNNYSANSFEQPAYNAQQPQNSFPDSSFDNFDSGLDISSDDLPF